MTQSLGSEPGKSAVPDLTQAHLAFAGILASVCATVLESMAVSVALPTIAADFGISASASTWVLGASQFVIVALILPAAAFGEAYGYRRLYLPALGLYSLATLACMFAPSFEVLVAARVFQAMGVAGAMSVNFALVRAIYPDAHVGFAIGLLATTVALASTAGPALAGPLIAFAGWSSVFALMLPFGLTGLVLSARYLPQNLGGSRHFDARAAALVAISAVALLTAINALANGWPIWICLGGLAITVIGGLAIARVQQGQERPIFPIDLLRVPIFALSIVASVASFMAQSLAFVTLPFFFVQRAGLTPVEMAAMFAVWPLAVACLAPILGRLSNRIPAGPVGAVGLLVLAVGLILMALLPADPSPFDIAWRMVICGLGFAAFQTPNNRLIMLTAPKERSGAASGMVSIGRQFGRAMGTALAAFALGLSQTGTIGLQIAAALALIGAVASFGRAIALGKSGK